MARANFGGAQDQSQTFMFLYEQYAQRQEDLANQAIREAEEAQAAADQDAMNRWEAGEMTDTEWIAYAKSRLAESTDEEDKTAWREVIRDSREQITTRRIEDGARDLINRIEAGTATWSDLANFYTRERAKLKEGSPMHRDLTEQIDQVNDRIADNATEGTIGQAQYLFQSGQISGAEAAAMIRGAAERYRTSDPGRYYQLLSSAYDLQTYGAAGGGSAGGSGGGGPSMADTIDSLEYTADAIDLLNDQFKNGKRIGTLPDGQEVPIADESGNPTGTWREIDRLMIETLDANYEARLANGERGAVEVLQRKEAYIETAVQPRNTIPREAQFNALTRDLERVIATGDPKAVQSVLGTMERWAGRLNTTTTSTDVQKRAKDSKVRENPELAAAVRRQTTEEADELEQVTDEFAVGVQQAVAALRQAYDNPNLTPEQAQQILAAAGPLVATRPELFAGLQEISTKTNGLSDGSFVRVMLPDGTMDAVPMVSSSVPGPDGNPIRELRPDIDFDPDSQGAVQVLREINGRPELVWAVGDYRDVQGQRMLAISDGGTVLLKGDESPAWTSLDGTEVSLPFFGASKSNAQRWVNAHPDAAQAMLASNGVDPAAVDMSRLFYPTERLVSDRENESQRDYAFQAQHSRTPLGQSRNPRITGSIEPGRPPSQPSAAGNFNGTNFLGLGQTGSKVMDAGTELGIRFKVQDRRTRFSGPGIKDVRMTRVNIQRPNIRPVNIRPVAPLRLSLPQFSNISIRRPAIQQQIHDIRSNSESGFI